MSVVTVHTKLVARRPTEDDAHVAGKYKVLVNDNVPKGHVAGVALDVFHSHVAVACLDDFEFTVKAGKKVLVESDDYKAYSGEDKGDMI